jgi:hypothetical protein
MFNRQCEARFAHQLHDNIVQSNSMLGCNLLGSKADSFSAHSQKETDLQAYTSSGQSGSFDSFLSNSSVTLGAQQSYESISRISNPGSNCSSICSSASTLSAATMCLQLQVSSEMASGVAPSFNFQKHRAYCDTTSHTSTPYTRSIHIAVGRPTSFAPQLDSLSIGTGIFGNAASHFHPSSLHNGISAQEQGIEEFSLGSGYPG